MDEGSHDALALRVSSFIRARIGIDTKVPFSEPPGMGGGSSWKTRREQSQASKQASRKGTQGARGAILLVDDDEGMADAIRPLAKVGGWTLVCARSVAAADVRLRSPARFVGLVIDGRLPDGRGVLVLRQARQRHPCVNILALTACGEDGEFANVAHEIGAEYAQKPSSAVEVFFRRLIVRQHHSDESVVRVIDGFAAAQRLSFRETEVVALGMLDYSYKEMGEAMGVTVNTVRDFERAIRAKSGEPLSGILFLLRRQLRTAAAVWRWPPGGRANGTWLPSVPRANA